MKRSARLSCARLSSGRRIRLATAGRHDHYPLPKKDEGIYRHFPRDFLRRQGPQTPRRHAIGPTVILPMEATTMRDLVFWTGLVGGAPLALALIRRAVEWSLDAIRAGTIARASAARERPSSESGLQWTHG